jgi:hypothetical protein
MASGEAPAGDFGGGTGSWREALTRTTLVLDLSTVIFLARRPPRKTASGRWLERGQVPANPLGLAQGPEPLQDLQRPAQVLASGFDPTLVAQQPGAAPMGQGQLVLGLDPLQHAEAPFEVSRGFRKIARPGRLAQKSPTAWAARSASPIMEIRGTRSDR